jgi:hypothetical protein
MIQTAPDGQTYETEDHLRRQFFMAKVTGRTTSNGLEREASPQKHLTVFKQPIIENYTTSPSRNNLPSPHTSNDMTTVMRLTRDAALEKL